MTPGARVVVASDKFKGTATSEEVGAAMARAVRAGGHDALVVPMSDGGDGLLAVYGGADRHTEVTGPLGTVVRAGWLLRDGQAVIENAQASGLVLAGGAEGNDPVAATSAGTGELIEAAVAAGASRIVVGVGGSASTDGGMGAVAALSDTTRALLRGAVELVVCCDVGTRYEDAARVFAPQKGATAEQVVHLSERLERSRRELETRFGIDVQRLAGSGAAGGLAGGLAAVGGRLANGFDVVAEHTRLANSIATAALVLTGEGQLDATSFDGKVVGGVAELAGAAGVPLAAVVGDVVADVEAPFALVSLVERFGRERALGHALDCIERVATELLEVLGPLTG